MVTPSKSAIEAELQQSFLTYDDALAAWYAANPYAPPPAPTTPEEYIAQTEADPTGSIQTFPYTAATAPPTYDEDISAGLRVAPPLFFPGPYESATNVPPPKDTGPITYGPRGGQTEAQLEQLEKTRQKMKRNLPPEQYQIWLERHVPQYGIDASFAAVGPTFRPSKKELVGDVETGLFYEQREYVTEIPGGYSIRSEWKEVGGVAKPPPDFYKERDLINYNVPQNYGVAQVDLSQKRFIGETGTFVPIDKKAWERGMESNVMDISGTGQESRLRALGLAPSRRMLYAPRQMLTPEEKAFEFFKAGVATAYILRAPWEIPATVIGMGKELVMDISEKGIIGGTVEFAYDTPRRAFVLQPELTGGALVAMGALGLGAGAARVTSKRFGTRKPKITERIETAQFKEHRYTTDLTTLRGVGKTYQAKLQKAGIKNIQDLSLVNSKTLAKKLKVPTSKVESWVAQSKKIIPTRTIKTMESPSYRQFEARYTVEVKVGKKAKTFAVGEWKLVNEPPNIQRYLAVDKFQQKYVVGEGLTSQIAKRGIDIEVLPKRFTKVTKGEFEFTPEGFISDKQLSKRFGDKTLRRLERQTGELLAEFKEQKIVRDDVFKTKSEIGRFIDKAEHEMIIKSAVSESKLIPDVIEREGIISVARKGKRGKTTTFELTKREFIKLPEVEKPPFTIFEPTGKGPKTPLSDTFKPPKKVKKPKPPKPVRVSKRSKAIMKEEGFRPTRADLQREAVPIAYEAIYEPLTTPPGFKFPGGVPSEMVGMRSEVRMIQGVQPIRISGVRGKRMPTQRMDSITGRKTSRKQDKIRMVSPAVAVRSDVMQIDQQMNKEINKSVQREMQLSEQISRVRTPSKPIIKTPKRPYWPMAVDRDSLQPRTLRTRPRRKPKRITEYTPSVAAWAANITGRLTRAERKAKFTGFELRPIPTKKRKSKKKTTRRRKK